MNDLKRTPLYDRQLQLGARMVEFGGWQMPVQYSGLTAEHRAVRERAGLFDISHMGKYRIEGADALEQLQSLVPSNLARLSPGRAQYTLLLNEQGGIIDDVIFYYQAPGNWLVIVNGATNDKDRRHLEAHLQGVQLGDLGTSHTLLALQGPEAQAVLQPLADGELGQIERFGHAQVQLLGLPAFVARTGYTGEDGFEILMAAADGLVLWDRLIAQGVLPCGLGARDTLRLEAAMHLYGQDMDESTTPLEAGLGWVIDWDKPDFLGRAALEAQRTVGSSRKLVGFAVEGREIARHGHSLWKGDRPVGTVTSGTLPPTQARPVGLAYIDADLSRVGSRFEVDIRGRRVEAVVVKRPFYRRPG